MNIFIYICIYICICRYTYVYLVSHIHYVYKHVCTPISISIPLSASTFTSLPISWWHSSLETFSPPTPSRPSYRPSSQPLSRFLFFHIQYWKDELLVWDPADYNGTTRITIEGQQIWLPELAIRNT